SFEQMRVYKETKDRIAAIIKIPDLKEETFGLDLSNMLQQKITFNEAIDSPDRNIMTRQRLKLIRDQLFSQIDNAMVI
ncbi:TPA: conjugal transfer protein TraL, partial [Legionella pneumophila]|nr:conjugal transfer protein TraL [Legionella pneumophila]